MDEDKLPRIRNQSRAPCENREEEMIGRFNPRLVPLELFPSLIKTRERR
jgi:hypothetical protein